MIASWHVFAWSCRPEAVQAASLAERGGAELSGIKGTGPGQWPFLVIKSGKGCSQGCSSAVT